MSLFWNANWEFISRSENFCVGFPVSSKHRAIVVSMVVWSHDKKNRNVRWNHSRVDITKAWMSFACKCMVNKSIFMLRPVAKLGDSKIQPYTAATLIFKSWCYLWEWRWGGECKSIEKWSNSVKEKANKHQAWNAHFAVDSQQTLRSLLWRNLNKSLLHGTK